MSQKNRGLLFALFYFFILTPLSLFAVLVIVISLFIIKAVRQKLGMDKEIVIIEPTVRHARIVYVRQ